MNVYKYTKTWKWSLVVVLILTLVAWGISGLTDSALAKRKPPEPAPFVTVQLSGGLVTDGELAVQNVVDNRRKLELGSGDLANKFLVKANLSATQFFKDYALEPAGTTRTDIVEAIATLEAQLVSGLKPRHFGLVIDKTALADSDKHRLHLNYEPDNVEFVIQINGGEVTFDGTIDTYTFVSGNTGATVVVGERINPTGGRSKDRLRLVYSNLLDPVIIKVSGLPLDP